jgi:tetratricopeptide (TPR) repeat protein
MFKKTRKRPEPSPVLKLRMQAQELSRAKRSDLAEGILRQAIAMEPDNAGTHQQLSACLFNLRRLDEAVEEAKAAVALNPASHGTHTMLGALYMVQLNYEGAIAEYQQALAIKPDAVVAINAMAGLWILKSKWAEALEWADKGLAFQADHVDLLRHRGEALAALKRGPEALATMEQFLRLAPDTANSQATASAILRRLGRTEEAAAFSTEALGKNPTDAYRHVFHGNVRLEERKFDEAMRHFKEAEELCRSRPVNLDAEKLILVGALFGQANVNRFTRHFALAETQYRQVLELNPDHSEAPALLALIIGVQKRFDEAFALARDAVQRHPKSLNPQLTTGYLFVATEQHDEALAQARKAMELFPNTIGPHGLFADIYLDQENYSDTLKEVQTALELKQRFWLRQLRMQALAGLGRPEAMDEIQVVIAEEPDGYYTHEAVGYAYYLLRDYVGAERHFLRAMQSDPSGLGCHNWLGLTYFQQRRISEARPLLEKAISLNPHQRRVHAALAAIAEGPAARK